MEPVHTIIAIIGGYLLGSIPFGLLITRATGGGDIRDIGSGNIGATNVLRTGRKELAALTLLLDAGKAALAVLLINHFFGAPYGLMAGAAALIGHCYPVWLKFDGGKGVAAFFGCLLAAAWPVGLLAMLLWLMSAFISRTSSQAALTAASTAPLAALFLGYTAVAYMAVFLAIVIYIRHRENINRILKGTEPKIGKKD